LKGNVCTMGERLSLGNSAPNVTLVGVLGMGEGMCNFGVLEWVKQNRPSRVMSSAAVAYAGRSNFVHRLGAPCAF
jgi:hypothetical protein